MPHPCLVPMAPQKPLFVIKEILVTEAEYGNEERFDVSPQGVQPAF